MAELYGSLVRRAEGLRRAVTARRMQRVIEASGFFDPDWYLESNPDVRAASRSPSRHYLVDGYREGRDPGPLFDSEWYLSRHPEVEQAGINPLVQFLGSDPAQGRTARSLSVTPPRGRTNVTVELPPSTKPPGTVAVMVHAFYPDTFDVLCEAMRSLTFPFTLLVSVPTESARTSAMKSISRHRLPADADVRVYPNQGRNFAPLVAGFATEVSRHDFVLHLHTKKSLFTGAEQAEWRDELVASLIGSPAVVTATLELFSARPDVGLVYPATAASVTYWAHHWLSNRHLVPGLFSRLGVDEIPANGYFEYPVGGMFWARVDAIRPLLDAGITFDDFPPEAGQKDGTLAHAIERCFVPLAGSRGYRFVEFDRRTGAFQLNWGSKNLEQYRTLSSEGLRQAIERADLVSFDIFDTIVTRLSVRPDAVIRAAGERIRRQYPGAEGFFDRRKQAETAARARKSWSGDVSLSEIYAELPRGGVWTDEVAAVAMATELECDMAASVPRSTVVEAARLARALGKRVIAISDTYFERSSIEQLLRSVDLLECFDDIYISSELGARKDRGDLWDLVVAKESIPVEGWLHVGDNERSDIQAASDRGMRTYHCMNPTTLLALRGLDCLSAADANRWGTDLLLGPVVARLGDNPFLDGHDYQPLVIPEATDLGYCVFGPVVMAFLAWIAQHPAIQGVDHLYFLSREGYLLREIWERIRATGAGELPESTYLLTSRRSSMAAAQAVAFDADQILQGFGFEGTVRDMLASRLGLALAPDDRFADMRLTLPDDEVAGRKILKELEDTVVAHGREELGHLVEYLRRVELTSTESAAIVDIGYSATTQKHLQTLIGHGLTGFYMGTVAKAGEVAAAGGTAFGCFAENVPKWTPTSAFHHHSIILEAFLTAPHGQFERAEVRHDQLVHHFRKDHRTPDELRVIEMLHIGATRYCDDLLDAYGRTVIDVPIDRAATLDLVTLFATGGIESPGVAPSLVVDDDFCGVPRRAAPVAVSMPGSVHG